MKMTSASIGMSIKSNRESSQRIDRKLREKSKVFRWEDLKFPINLIDMENHNSSISVNVFDNENLVYPLAISEHNYKR